MLNEVSFEGRRFTSLIPSKCEVKSPYPWISIQPRIRPHTPWHGISMRVYAGEFPRTLLAGNCVSGIHLCYSAWQVGLPKEAGSKEHKMSIFPTRILLATDGSEEATLAAQTAIDLANKTGSELHVGVRQHIALLSCPF
jgi:hypothetical protein